MASREPAADNRRLHTLHLDVLPLPQRRLWSELGAIPSRFVLYGGTALALHLGHRQSIDFDFFTSGSLDPEPLYASVSWLGEATTLRQSPDTLIVRVDRDGPVRVSFFSTPALRQLEPPRRVADPAIGVATLLDLAGTKASVVQQRAESKDYLDIDALLVHGLPLPRMLAAASAIFGSRFEPQSTLKALSYFGDGDLPTLPPAVQDRLRSAVRAVDLDHLPAVGRPRGGIGE